MESLADFKADIFRILANPTRLRIIELLEAAGSLTVGEIQQRLGLESANVSQHLAVLRSRGLVRTKREGTSIWYAVAEPDIFELLNIGDRIFEHQHQTRSRLLEARED